MSEISDAVQIIRVAYDGVEIAMKVGSGSISAMQKGLSVLIGMLDYEKSMGKTSMRKLLMKGGDLQVLEFKDEDMKRVQKLLNKYGVLYSVMPDMNRADGKKEILFHCEAAPRVQMLVQKLGSEHTGIKNFDDFLKEGNGEELNKLLKFFEKQKQGNGKLHTEEDAIANTAIDGLIAKVGRYAMEKQSISVESVRQNFNVEAEDAKKVINQLEKIGVLDKPDDSGVYKVIMDQEAFEKRVNRYQELSNRMRTIAASKNTDLMDVTITKKLIFAENDHAVKTRIPGTWGDKAQYIWINKSDIMEIHSGKTMLTYLDKGKDYKIYSEDNRVLSTIRGSELYSKHYDPVESQVRQRYAKAKVGPAKKTEQIKRR